MSRDWQSWWNTAGAMLNEATESHERNALIAAAFLAHQGAESALKAVWIVVGDGNPPHIHNLVELAEGLEAPDSVVDACRELNPLYMTSRYPDAANGEPRRQLNTAITGRAIDASARVAEWCGEQLASLGGEIETDGH